MVKIIRVWPLSLGRGLGSQARGPGRQGAEGMWPADTVGAGEARARLSGAGGHSFQNLLPGPHASQGTFPSLVSS